MGNLSWQVQQSNQQNVTTLPAEEDHSNPITPNSLERSAHLIKITGILILASLIFYFYTGFAENTLPGISTINQTIIHDDPVQVSASQKPFDVMIKQYRYQITPFIYIRYSWIGSYPV